MAWPYSPLVTFSDNTVPKVSGDFLNQLQKGVNAAAYPQYLSRPEIQMGSTDGATVVFACSPLMMLDTATSKYRYCSIGTVTVGSAQWPLTPGIWPASTWVYTYGKCTNGVFAAELSDIAPIVFSPDSIATATPLFKGGPDETRRYLGCFYCDGARNVVAFRMLNGRYDWLSGDELARRVVDFATPTGGAWNSASVAAVAPPHAKSVEITGMLFNDYTGGNQNYLQVSSIASNFAIVLAVTAAYTGSGPKPSASGDRRVPLFGSTIYWRISFSLGGSVAALYCPGFEE
jgi:hypothetical protein